MFDVVEAGVMNLTQTLAVEWAAAGIRVNCLVRGVFPHEHLPGPMRAAGAGGADARARRIPAGRVGRLHELGWAATYLCSPFAAYLSGPRYWCQPETRSTTQALHWR